MPEGIIFYCNNFDNSLLLEMRFIIAGAVLRKSVDMYVCIMIWVRIHNSKFFVHMYVRATYIIKCLPIKVRNDKLVLFN